MNFSNDLDIELIVNPLIFYHDYDKFTYYDNGKKVLAPKFLLHRLSQYNNIEYPIHIKINNTIFTVGALSKQINHLKKVKQPKGKKIISFLIGGSGKSSKLTIQDIEGCLDILGKFRNKYIKQVSS